MSELALIARTLWARKTGPILIFLQVAFTTIVFMTAWTVVEQRMDLAAKPSGLAEADLFHLSSYGFASDFDARSVGRRDLEILRGQAGVLNAIQTNSIPLSGVGQGVSLQTEAGADLPIISAGLFYMDEHGLETLGLDLVAGVGFTIEDVQWRRAGLTQWPSIALVSRDLAESLFPENWSNIVGKTIFLDETNPIQVKGVVTQLTTAWRRVDRSIVFPAHLEWDTVHYIVRTEPGRRDVVMSEIRENLDTREDGRIIEDVKSMQLTRAEAFAIDLGMANLLGVVMFALLCIVSFGVGGLVSYSVRQRSPQIGIRRALGASKGMVLSYFQIENLLIVVAGIILGSVCAVILNIVLGQAMGLPKIDWLDWLLTSSLIICVCQAATLGPANAAAKLNPVEAMRGGNQRT